MSLSIFACCIDPALGRIDYAGLPDQALLEIVIEQIDNKEMINSKNNDLQDLSDWRGARLYKNGQAYSIGWGGLGLRGSVNLAWLPRNMRHLSLSRNELTGTLDLSNLPDVMESLHIDRNNFEGTLNLKNLPQSIESVFLYENMFTGSLDLEQLYENLTDFDPHRNNFSGTLETKQFQNIIDLNFSDNAFVGEVNYLGFSDELWKLNLRNNKFDGTFNCAEVVETDNYNDLLIENNSFQGSFHIVALPWNIHSVKGRNNKFSGSLILDGLTDRRMMDIDLRGNLFTGNINLSALPDMGGCEGEYISVDLSCNLLSGSLNISRIPPCVNKINLADNDFAGEISFEGVSKFTNGELDLSGNNVLTKVTARGMTVILRQGDR